MNASACWSPDGKRIAVTLSPLNPNPQAGRDSQPLQVVVVDLDGGGQSKIILPDAGTDRHARLAMKKGKKRRQEKGTHILFVYLITVNGNNS